MSESTIKVKPDETSTFERARTLVLEHGWNSTSFQIINPGISRWFSAAGDAVVGYVNGSGVRVVAGAPVCAEERLADVAAEFETDAVKAGETICYFCAERRLESVYSSSEKHSKVLLGAQPTWHPRNWAEIIAKHKSLRAQLSRARNKGVTVGEWPAERARNNPDLRGCLDAWLESKGLPPLHFMVEPNILDRVEHRRIFVAEKDGGITGFVILSPVAMRNGWLFEQFPHVPESPNGTVELMIDAAMSALAASGSGYATLGLAPLSKRAVIEPFDNPVWLRIFLTWMRKHGKRFYNFDGLDAFKTKLKPERWEPLFAISNEPKFSFRTLHAIASAFSRDAPANLFLGGLRRAFITEAKWIKARVLPVKNEHISSEHRARFPGE